MLSSIPTVYRYHLKIEETRLAAKLEDFRLETLGIEI